MRTFNTDSFADYTLEDFIRYLATWDLPDDDQHEEMLKIILLLCREWSKVKQ